MDRAVHPRTLAMARRILMLMAATLVPTAGVQANSPIAERLTWYGGVWEVTRIDGLHTAPRCVITLSGRTSRGVFALSDTSRCPIREIAASTGWSWGLRLYDSSGNQTADFSADPGKETYGAESPGYGRMTMRRLSMPERLQAWVDDLLRHGPGTLAALSMLMLVIAARQGLITRSRKRR